MSEPLANLIRRIARAPGGLLARTGVSPNAVTVAGGVLNCALAAALALGQVAGVAAGILILSTGFIDALDGAVARHTGRVTPFGAFLDSVVDRLSDGIVIAGLLVAALRRGQTLEVAALASCLVTFPLVSYTRAAAERLGIACRNGIMTRPMRILCLALAVCVGVVGPVMALVAVGSAFTAAERVLHVRRALGEGGGGRG